MRTGLACACLFLGACAEEQVGDKTPPLQSSEAAFWHVGLVVQDMETMHRFYSEVIGLKQVTDLHVSDDRVTVDRNTIAVNDLDALMGLDDTVIEIRHYSDPRHPLFLELLRYPDHGAEPVDRAANKPLGLNHLGIAVADIDQVLERISTSGLGELFGGPSVLPEFENNRYAFIRDPEGNLVELMEMKSEAQP